MISFLIYVITLILLRTQLLLQAMIFIFQSNYVHSSNVKKINKIRIQNSSPKAELIILKDYFSVLETFKNRFKIHYI